MSADVRFPSMKDNKLLMCTRYRGRYALKPHVCSALTRLTSSLPRETTAVMDFAFYGAALRYQVGVIRGDRPVIPLSLPPEGANWFVEESNRFQHVREEHDDARKFVCWCYRMPGETFFSLSMVNMRLYLLLSELKSVQPSAEGGAEGGSLRIMARLSGQVRGCFTRL
jgi:hypothetical protein